ncbi:MAG: competence/damage-inducible protein A [Planctomycetia bacterium]|jgi:nicotinamide-nucleotide amidase
MNAEVIAIGDELTTGQRLDTNSQWISRELAVLGITTSFHTTITDALDDGVAAFRIAVERADVVVVTGGLGPTADDLTRDVLAIVANEPLELSAEALVAVETRFARRAMPMPESNRRQALFPRTSRIITNPDGTAPGIDLEILRQATGSSRVFALPGVPAEMRVMWHDSVVPALLAMQPEGGTIQFRRIKCFGAGESAVEAMLPDLIERGRDPLVGITAHEATITLRIVARGADAAACRAKIAPTERIIRECLGDLVYGNEDDEIEDAALAAVAAAGYTLATVEIATQGQVAALVAQAAARRRAAGAAGGVAGAIVMPDETRGRTPADLAAWARAELGGSLGLAVGPVQRDADGMETVAIALARPEGTDVIEHRLGGSGSLRLSRASKTALDFVRKRLRLHS